MGLIILGCGLIIACGYSRDSNLHIIVSIHVRLYLSLPCIKRYNMEFIGGPKFIVGLSSFVLN